MKKQTTSLRELFHHKTILITGGTGTFGKRFSKTLLKEYPEIKKLIIFSRDEFKQFEMSNSPEFKKDPRVRFFIGDVRDKDRLERAFYKVDYVVHAAALKQIESCEYNPFEAVKTNVYGAQNVIDAAINCKVKKVVALSTDKACAPINLYGATKLCSDKLFISGNSYVGTSKTRFAVVRYGNVAGSRGSVIPYFQDLINTGEKKIPITNKKMTRFWLKLDNAVNMVIYGLKKMQGGELYIRKIPSIKLVDLAKAMAPHLPIQEIGMRKGEKIHEMMISQEDAPNTLEYKNHYIIRPEFDWWTPPRNGAKVADNFEYHSGNNAVFLTVEQIKKLIKTIDK